MRFSVILIVLLVSCNKENQAFQSKVIAHAGAGLDISYNPFPDNTQDAVTYSVNLGATCVEVDIQLTTDNHFFLFHDDFLNGKTTHEGCVNSKSKEEMEGVRYTFHAAQKINELTKMNFDGVEELFLDVRHLNTCNSLIVEISRIIDAIAEFSNVSKIPKIVIASNHVSILDGLGMPNVTRCYEADNFESLKSILEQKDYPLYMIRNKHISTEQVAWLHDNGKKVIIFDMRSHEGNIKALEKNPDYIMTDAVESGLSLTR